jgi:uncharacterized protein
MINPDLINATIKFVKRELENAEGGHDWFHIQRVYKNSLLIANLPMISSEVDLQKLAIESE